MNRWEFEDEREVIVWELWERENECETDTAELKKKIEKEINKYYFNESENKKIYLSLALSHRVQPFMAVYCSKMLKIFNYSTIIAYKYNGLLKIKNLYILYHYITNALDRIQIIDMYYNIWI